MEGNARDAEGRRMLLDVDLNHPPLGEIIYLSGRPEVVEGQGNGNAQEQAASDVAVTGDDDDDVEIISPRRFAEATKNSRRRMNRAATEVPHDDDSLLNIELQLANPCYRGSGLDRFLNSGGSNRSQNIATDTRGLVSPPVVPESNPEPESSSHTFHCPICRDKIVEATSTKCGHIFCKTCIEKAIATQHKCPNCRKRLSKRSILKVHLPKPS